MNGFLSKTERAASAAELLNNVNPLYLKSLKTGEVIPFKSVTEMYLYLLEYLRAKFPRGYFEPAYVSYLLYNISNGDRRVAVRQLRRSPRAPAQVWVLFINWTNLGLRDEVDLRTFFERLHALVGTEFRKENFEEAFKQFKQRENEIDRTLYGGGNDEDVPAV